MEKILYSFQILCQSADICVETRMIAKIRKGRCNRNGKKLRSMSKILKIFDFLQMLDFGKNALKIQRPMGIA